MIQIILKELVKDRILSLGVKKFYTRMGKYGVSYSSLRRWIRGDGVPSPKSIKKLSKLFGLPTEFFNLGGYSHFMSEITWSEAKMEQALANLLSNVNSECKARYGRRAFKK